jgi:hypothetical protein
VSKLDGASTRVKLQHDPTTLAVEQRLSRASRSSGHVDNKLEEEDDTKPLDGDSKVKKEIR